MKKDKALEELFLEHKPHFDDQAAFMSELTRRLDNVEYIRRHEEAAMRRYKIAMVAAFVDDCEVPATGLFRCKKIALDEYSFPVKEKQIFVFIADLHADLIVGCDTKGCTVLRQMPVFDCEAKQHLKQSAARKRV